MDLDERLVGRVVAVEHDFPDQDMGDPLLGSGVRARRIPCRRQIVGEHHQRRTIDRRAERHAEQRGRRDGRPRSSAVIPGAGVSSGALLF
jgi:hypothetical protein